MSLDVMSSGADPEHARKDMDEVVHVFIQTAADNGTLEEILISINIGVNNNIRITVKDIYKYIKKIP